MWCQGKIFSHVRSTKWMTTIVVMQLSPYRFFLCTRILQCNYSLLTKLGSQRSQVSLEVTRHQDAGRMAHGHATREHATSETRYREHPRADDSDEVTNMFQRVNLLSSLLISVVKRMSIRDCHVDSIRQQTSIRFKRS